ncbi:SLC13 family permease [Lignipirellula cremea]|uniref:Citrate transporter n=1 Tax=Lignipirellula cremea TaxID=2528010 RepID=A0A518DTQ6_9BACT|nr:SLC13 family permease [Lignipirellula cremea]QDU95226.1 Citrate transporter [Lignipirellula cremea]
MNFQDLHPWLAVIVVMVAFVLIQVRRNMPVDFVFLLGLMIVTLAGIITPREAFAGFSNPAVLTLASLLIVAASLRQSGVLDAVGHALLGRESTERGAFLRLAVSLVFSSAFLLNTALVAMMAPVVVDWCRRRNVSPSRLMMPVSYFAILGGVCTLIGTSTTLVVNAKLRSEYEDRLVQVEELRESQPQDQEKIAAMAVFAEEVRPMKLFELGKVGLPCAIAGSVFLILFGPRLLPNRTDMLERLGEQRREYLVEMLVSPECRLIGQTVELAGLRQLPGLFLIEIDRDGEVITPVAPHHVIHAGDRLVFTGVVSTIVDLEKIPGLIPAADISYDMSPVERRKRHLCEVVLSRTSPLIGTTVRDAKFRQLYNAAIVAVHRNGLRLTNKIGNISLEPGDTLLLQTHDEFPAAYRNHRDFYLVSSVEGSKPLRREKAWLAATLSIGLVLWLAVASLWDFPPAFEGLTSSAVAGFCVVVLLILTGCLRLSEARNSIDLQIFTTIAAALGLGLALTKSGAADQIARLLVDGVSTVVTDEQWRPFLLLAVMYLITAVFTEMITNNAVAAMFFSLAVALAEEGGYSPRPFIMAVTLAASLSFVTPIGYQTNLMVMGPGGYRPVDYLRCGLPLSLVVATTALPLISTVWPF